MSIRDRFGAGILGLVTISATPACVTGDLTPKSTEETGGAAGTRNAVGGAPLSAGERNEGGSSGKTSASGKSSGGATLVNATATGGTALATPGTAGTSGGRTRATSTTIGQPGATSPGGITTTTGTTGIGGLATAGGTIATGGSSATGGTNATTGGTRALGGSSAAGGAGPIGTTSPPSCTNKQQDGTETAIDCGGSCGSTCPPNDACGAPDDCASFLCSNKVCGAYATSCLELKQRGAPPGKYVIDTDGTGDTEPFLAYCPTVGTNLAPVGICQAEVGAPPACRSFVGAVGYDFKGVDFGGTMRHAGILSVKGQPVVGNREVLEISDGTILATQYDQNVTWVYGTEGTVNPLGGVNTSNPHGVIQLSDRRFLVTGAGVFVLSAERTLSSSLTSTASASVSQLISGEIWVPSISVFNVLRFYPDGTSAGAFDNAGFLSGTVGYGPNGVVQLVDGTIIVSNSGTAVGGGTTKGRLVYIDSNLAQRKFAIAPTGMTVNSDGSLTPSQLTVCGTPIQLPNEQVLIPASHDLRIVRLNANGAVADTFSTGIDLVAGGMTLDHRGRLLVANVADSRIHVIVFPGCSSGTRDGTETDVDCGGICTTTCGAGRTCKQNSDCQSGVCTHTICDG